MENKLTRRESRENAFLAAFAATFGEEELEALIETRREDEEHPLDAFGEKLLRDYYDHSAEIDDIIRDRLKNWTIDRIPRVSSAMLRLALSEILYGDEKKPGVAINEAVELVKKYGAENDFQFVNGLLGAAVRDLGLVDAAEQEPPTC